jgi:hypothetical protein
LVEAVVGGNDADGTKPAARKTSLRFRWLRFAASLRSLSSSSGEDVAHPEDEEETDVSGTAGGGAARRVFFEGGSDTGVTGDPMAAADGAAAARRVFFEGASDTGVTGALAATAGDASSAVDVANGAGGASHRRAAAAATAASPSAGRDLEEDRPPRGSGRAKRRPVFGRGSATKSGKSKTSPGSRDAGFDLGAFSGGSELLVKPLRVGGDGGKAVAAGDIIPGILKSGAALKGRAAHVGADVLAGGAADVLAGGAADAFVALGGAFLALGDMTGAKEN